MRSDSRKRYSSTEAFSYPDGAPRPYRGLKPREVKAKTAYVEHEIKPGDRLDTLAQAYYGDPRLWWVIAQANPDAFFPADIVYQPAPDADGVVETRAGRVIAIPSRPEGPT